VLYETFGTQEVLVLRKDLSAFGNYGADGKADILYSGEAATWHFDVPASVAPDSIKTAFFRASLVADDHYDVALDRYGLAVWTNAAFLGNAPPALPHGTPYIMPFLNWTQRDFAVPGTGTGGATYSVSIMNTTRDDSGDSPNWIGVDWIELHLFTVALAPADLIVSATHGGTFARGSADNAYVVSVSNVGAGPTMGVVTVNNALSSGASASNVSGQGWSCDVVTLRCTREDVLAAGASYPPIVVTVQIDPFTGSNVFTDTASVSGGGEAVTWNDGWTEGAATSEPDSQRVDTTITSVPVGLNVMVDGVQMAAPHTFSWPVGSIHNLGAPPRQPSPYQFGEQYLFGSWSDSSPQEHSITVLAFPWSYTATFATP
jgi:hypothetical protein